MSNRQKKTGMAITVDDGSRRVPVCNMDGEEIGTFVFHPTDIGIVERYNRMAETFDAVTEPLRRASGEEEASEAGYMEALKEAEKRLYAAVNELLGGDAAGAFFGKVHPFSPVDGAFYCERALEAVGAFIAAQFDRETLALSDRAKRYLA